MAIKLIKEDEKYETEVHGCKFWYRRIPYDKKVDLQTKNTKRGKVDDEAFGKALLCHSILGWDGVMDGEEPAVFSTEKLLELPWSVIEELLGVVGGSVDGTDPF
jgi:hypothetical protein